jgi:protein involved in polysaccharide export with SLBB domain
MVTALLVAPGCGQVSHAWWNAFLNPTEVGNFRDDNVVLEIQRTISFRDTPPGVVGAVDPKPSDLVAKVEEYRIGPNDVISIRLLDFIQLGAETELQLTVDELGRVHIPQLGWMNIEGMTIQELQQEIIERAKAAEIYLADADPTVTVTVLQQQQRLFNLDGSVRAPGPYRIPRSDFRLREAILLGGGLDENAKVIYVFRDAPREKEYLDTPPAQDGRPVESIPEEGAPPVTPVNLSSFGRPNSGAPSAGFEGEGVRLAVADSERELLDALDSSGSRSAASPDSATNENGATGESKLPTYIFVDDKFVETPETAPTTQRAKQADDSDRIKDHENVTYSEPIRGSDPESTELQQTQRTEHIPAEDDLESDEPVDWEALAAEGRQRVIRIPAKKLRHGDPAVNVVIRHQDWIRIDPGPVGLYYMGGHVARPGPFAFSGQEITLTQAVIGAGMLDQLAWPTRCEIRRRLDGDREEITQWDLAAIMEGRAPDLFLRENDVVNVGTHAVAPILAAIRNAFRFTYGFGFVYDRNFADIDSFGQDINPKIRARAERDARFPGLF